MVFTKQIKNIIRFAKLSATTRLECVSKCKPLGQVKEVSTMTKNQIEYNKMLETQRANRENERLTGARDQETARHNLAGEAATIRGLDLQSQSLDETKRANLAREGLTAQELSLKDKQIGVQYAVGMAGAAASRYSAELSAAASRYATDSHYQLGSEQLAETHRMNTVNAVQGAVRLVQSGAQLGETHRANVQRENLESQKISETKRANQAREQETQRHNVVTESTQKLQTYGKIATDAANVGLRAVIGGVL